MLGAIAAAQTPESTPSQIEALSKKVDEVNAKLDALSQQLLKLEQQMPKPGVMVGEATPALAEPAHPAATANIVAGSNTYVVAKGETLIAIAKRYKVSVEELQKFNHIEDGRKLQAGQTIQIPPAAATPAATSSPTP